MATGRSPPRLDASSDAISGDLSLNPKRVSTPIEGLGEYSADSGNPAPRLARFLRKLLTELPRQLAHDREAPGTCDAFSC